MHRIKMVRENFELTEKIVKQKKSFFHLESQLADLMNEKQKTLAMSNITVPRSPLVKRKAEKGVFGNFIRDTDLREKNVDMLLKRASIISRYLDSFLRIMRDKADAIQVIPTTIPVSKKSFIIRGFGMVTDPFSGRRLFHSGLDFAGTLGDPVFAAGNGTVAKTGSDAFFGKKIRIKHGLNIETVYAHLESIEVRAGQKVARGQIIGALGNTGMSTGPHLHFEVIVNGEKKDPQLFYLRELPFQPDMD